MWLKTNCGCLFRFDYTTIRRGNRLNSAAPLTAEVVSETRNPTHAVGGSFIPDLHGRCWIFPSSSYSQLARELGVWKRTDKDGTYLR
jgi:hypothetical protein